MSEYGIIHNEPNDIYHANEAVSNSNIGDFIKRPSLYKKKHIDKDVERKETEAFAVGGGTHSAVLEGITAFNKNYCVLPDGFSLASEWAKKVIGYLAGETCVITDAGIKKTSKKGKEIKALVDKYTKYDILLGDDVDKYTQALKEIGGKKAIGKKPIRKKSFDEILDLINSVHSNPVARALLSSGTPEVTFRHKLNDFSVQCKTDWYCESAPEFDIYDPLLPYIGDAYACDLKTTQCLDDWVSAGFNNTISKFGYDQQEAFYRMVINKVLGAAGYDKIKQFFFIVVEKQEPKECAVFVINEETINAATRYVAETLGRMKECFISGHWPGFTQEIIITEVSERVRERIVSDADALRNISA